MKLWGAPLAIETEIACEKASALGRIARAFERDLNRLREFEAKLAQLPLKERARRSAAHQALRNQAARQLWYLIVQREAMGLVRHETVYEVYQLPPSLQPRP